MLKKIAYEKQLGNKFPEIAKEWHPTKNGSLTPFDFSYGSKEKVWWQCQKVKSHSYQASICEKTRKNRIYKCQICLKLGNKFPEIAKEWHPTKNGSLTPFDFSYGSKEKVWWQCQKVKSHSYQASICERTRKNPTSCSICGNKIIIYEKSLKKLNPEIAKEWHPTKNGSLTPDSVFNQSNKKVWWQCRIFPEHIWRTQIIVRTKQGSGCPKCFKQSSIQEIRILSEFQAIFKKVISRKKLLKKEIDIFLPEINVGIEYDGSYFHKNKFSKDKEKNTIFEAKNIHLIRVREKPLKKINSNDVLVSDSRLIKNDIDRILINLQKTVEIKSKSLNLSIKKYLQENDFINEKVYKKFLNYFPSPLPNESFAVKHPEIAKEWHFSKNKPLEPKHFLSGSREKVWWQCPKNKNHIWKAEINNRVLGKTGCPKCSGNAVSDERSLAKLYPEIAREWHPTKNGNLTPKDVTYGSGKKVWWQCPKNKNHIYESRITHRTNMKTGCRFCAGFKK